MTWVRLVGVAIAVCIAGSAAHADSPKQTLLDACPEPALGLSRPGTTAEIDLVSFVFERRTYQLEIASAVADRKGPSNSGYCVRYEPENITGKQSSPPPPTKDTSIEMFWWPAPAGIAEERLLPAHRPSRLVTPALDGGRPEVRPTMVYAFKNERIRTRAYFVSGIPTRLDFSAGPESMSLVLASSGPSAAGSEPVRASQRTIEPGSELPVSGVLFSGSTGEVAVTSNVTFDGKSYRVSTAIEADLNMVGPISAPYIAAVESVRELGDLVPYMRKSGGMPLPMTENVLSVDASFPFEAASAPIFLIQHPVVIRGYAGRACFLAPAYSPVAVPEDLQTCDPSVAFKRSPNG